MANKEAPGSQGLMRGLREGPWHELLLKGSSRPRVLIHVGIHYGHFCPPLFTSGREMSPHLEHNATFGLLLLWFQTLVTSSLSCGTGLCPIERDVLLKPRWDPLLLKYYQKLSLTPKYRPWAAKHLHDQIPHSLSKSSLTSYALAKPVPSSLSPFPTQQQVSCDNSLVQATVLSWLYNCDRLQQRSPLLIFCPSPILLRTSVKLIFKKVNNAHPFLKILCGTCRSITLKIKSKLFLLRPTGPTMSQPTFPNSSCTTTSLITIATLAFLLLVALAVPSTWTEYFSSSSSPTSFSSLSLR